MLVLRIFTILTVSLFVFAVCDGAPAVLKTKQFLPTEPGAIPVYIRPGDTPLYNINVDLAEAFNFNAIKHGRQAFGREVNALINEKNEKASLTATAGEKAKPKSPQKENQSQHIQKIPRH